MSITCATAACGIRASTRLSRRTRSLHTNRFCHTQSDGPCSSAIGGQVQLEALRYLVPCKKWGNSMPNFSTGVTPVVQATQHAKDTRLLSCLPAANAFKSNLNRWPIMSATVVACQAFFFAACWPPVCGKRQLYPERFLPNT